MKKYFIALILAIFVLAGGAAAADFTIHSKSAMTTLTADDLFIVEDSPGSSPSYKKLTWASLEANIKAYTDTLYQPLDTDLTALAAISGVRGDIIYFGPSGWTSLAKGTSGQYLKIGASDPLWADVTGGSMTYPAAGIPVSTGSAWGTSLNITAISDSTSTTSSTTAASATAVKAAYDLANGKQASSATLTSLAGLTETNGGLPYGTADNTYAWLAAGAAGKVLQGNGAAAPSWSTPTYPYASGTARKMLVSDGTNNVYSTETWAIPGTSGNYLKSDGTNWTSAAFPSIPTLTDSTSTTSSTVAASATAVKSAYDLANGKQSALTYPVTGIASPTAGYLTKWGASGNTLADALKYGTMTDTKYCTYTAANGLVCNSDGSGVMTYPGSGVPVSTGSAWGTSLNITAISDSTSTTSSTTASSATAVKAAYDHAPTLTDSTSTTSSTVAASATAVKSAYDTAAAKAGLTSPAFITDIHASTAGGANIGSATNPFGFLYFGNAANQTTRLGPAPGVASDITATLSPIGGHYTTTPATTATAGRAYLSTATAGAASWSTPTYPSASGTTRKMLVSDGTNNVYSTETWAVPGTSGNILKSDGTNWTSAAEYSYTHPSGDGNLHVPATSTTNNGKVLTAGATAGSLSWQTPSGGGGSVATDTIWDAAGDLAIGSGADTAVKLTKGSTGQVLTAGASTISWQTPTGGGDLKADGTVPLSAGWNAGNFVVTSGGFDTIKVTDVAGKSTRYQATGTGVQYAGEIGPASMSGNVSYLLRDPAAGPTVANSVKTYGASASGTGTTADPYIHNGTWKAINDYPTYSSTSTATGNINIDGASYSDYNFSNGSSTATYTPVITSPPPSGNVRYVTLTVGGGSGVDTMTWTNVTFMGTTGAAATRTSKKSTYACKIPSSGNALCSIVAEAY